MSTGAGLIVAVGALLAVMYLNRKSEQATAMKTQAIATAKSKQGFGFGDLLGVAAVAGATSAGGPAAGLRTFSATGLRL
jgi:hypothetical protein